MCDSYITGSDKVFKDKSVHFKISFHVKKYNFDAFSFPKDNVLSKVFVGKSLS